MEGLDRKIEIGGYMGSDARALHEKEDIVRTISTDESTDDHKDTKGHQTVIEVTDDSSSEDGAEDHFVKDPFVPFRDMPEERKDIVTIRAIVIGCMCGCLVNASNIYLGLKTGWTFSANIFGSILGFAILKFFSTTCAHIPILGGSFGPKENGILMTAATAAGGMSSVFISAFPAIYQLDLLTTPQHDFPKIIALTAVGGYFGLCFAAPLRKFFIVHVARELRLTFPSSSATAVTIRSMHAAVGGELTAKKKAWALCIAFAFAIILRVVSQYAIGILWDWHFFTWFFIWGNYHNAAMHVETWGWLVEWTPAFIGAGMIIGLNVAFSFFAGSVIAWGIIGPTLVKYGEAFCGNPYEGTKWEPYKTCFSLSKAYATPDHPSPRYWMLWPGVLLMIVVSFVELGCQYKVITMGGAAIARGTTGGIASALRAAGRRGAWIDKHAQDHGAVDELDPQLPENRIKTWMWLPGMIIIIILTCVVTSQLFEMPVGETLLAIFLAFFFSLLAIQCSGATDITPLTAASKATQLVLGGVTKGEHWAIQKAQRLNLLGGAVTSIGANQSSDLVGDFRVGFLLGTPANLQFLTQLIGTICAVFIAPGMYILFSKAYPCINDLALSDTCAFGLPSVSAWRAVTVAMTSSTFPVPTSSGIFAIVLSIVGGIMVLMRHFVWTGERIWMRKYWPNMMVIGLAFVIPQTVYGTANVMGAVLAVVWAKKNQRSFDSYGYAVAAGLIAGEGIGGVVNAIFQIAGIGGDAYGTQIACPGDSC